MDRAKELHKLFKDIDEGKQAIVNNLIDEAVFLEEQLTELKKYPFLKTRVHEKLGVQTKITPACKQYREFLQTYTNIIDKLLRIGGQGELEEDSPLRKFIKEINEVVKK